MGLYGYRDGYSVLGRIVCAIWYVGNGGVNLHGCKHKGPCLGMSTLVMCVCMGAQRRDESSVSWKVDNGGENS